MGANSTKRFNDQKVLHYLHPKENRISVFIPTTRKFYTFYLKRRGINFYLYYQESISLSTGAIYLIGGKVMSETKKDIFESPSKSTFVFAATTEVYKINLNKADHNLVIDLYEDVKPCKFLSDARYNHYLVYNKPWIFVLGGYDKDNYPVTQCLKFHTKTKEWFSMASLELIHSFKDYCALTYEDKYLYLFGSVANKTLPTVCKYLIDTDQWLLLSPKFSIQEMTIQPSIKSQVFQFTPDEVLIFAGLSNNLTVTGYYYVYNIKNDLFEEPSKSDTILPFNERNRQGDINYQDEKEIYFGFDGKCVRVFDIRAWDMYEIQEVITKRKEESGLNCCSR